MNIAITTTSGGATPETYANVKYVSILESNEGAPEKITLTQQNSLTKESVILLSHEDITSISITPTVST